MDKEKLNEIRRLLDRYYDGVSTREEELLLAQLFASTPDVPADMEADRQLFALARDMQAEMIHAIPAESDARILSALEEEIQATSPAANEAVATGAEVFRKKRKAGAWVAAVAAVACLAGIVLMTRPVQPEKQIIAANETNVADVTDVTEITDGADASDAAEVKAGDKKRSHCRGNSKHYAGRQVSTNQRAGSAQDTEDSQTSVSAVAAEPKVAEGYRVITDPREAEAILCAVITDMNSNIAFEQAKVAAVCDEIAIRVDNL